MTSRGLDMQASNLKKYMFLFLTIWSIWNLIEPLASIYQLTTLFILLPVSALLLAVSFLEDDNDDNDFGGGIMMPIIVSSRE